MPDRLLIAVLMGGRSPEHDVSLDSGRMVAGGLDPERYEVLPVVLTRQGSWRIPEDVGGPPPTAPDAAPELPVGRALDRLVEQGTDVAFLALHGPSGEDGTIQGLLEMAGLPYTGSGVLASSLAMDKERSRWIFEHLGLPMPAGLCVSRLAWAEERAAVVDRLGSEVPRPWVVKPADQGSSVAIAMIEEAGGLDDALAAVWEVSGRAFVEERIEGDELTCGVLEKPGGEALQALPLTLIRPREDEFFDYHAKYTPGATEEITPAPISEELTRSAQEISTRAFLALGCRGMARFDYMMDARGLFLLEGNTIPGMTQTSLLPQAAEAAGLSFAQLLDRLIDLAVERFDSAG